MNLTVAYYQLINILRFVDMLRIWTKLKIIWGVYIYISRIYNVRVEYLVRFVVVNG